MSAPATIKNEKGAVIGYKTSDGTYLKPSGEVVARVKNETTLDSKGQVKGKGDIGLMGLGGFK